jgi:hypothetical protein
MINKNLMKMYQKRYESRNSGSGTRKGVMNFNNVEFFKPEEGRNRVNIIPYTIKTKNHPMVRRGDCQIGEIDYCLDIWVHRYVGANESSVLCLKKNYGKQCPICEQADMLKKQGNEEAKSLNSVQRVYYNVQDLKDGKLKVFETSHFLFEKELIEEARDDDGGEGFVDFVDTENGKEVSFKCTEVKKGSLKFNEYKSFRFEDREEKISKDLLDSAISFDEILNVPTYEEVQKILFGSDDEDSETEDEKVIESWNVDDSDESESEKTEEKTRKYDNGCSYGHNFGKDCDNYDDCENCSCWDKCCKASD